MHYARFCNHADALVLLLAATMRAPYKDSLLAAWLTEDGRIEGLPHEAVADLHAFERWCVATKPAAQAAVAVKNQVQSWEVALAERQHRQMCALCTQAACRRCCTSGLLHWDVHARSNTPRFLHKPSCRNRFRVPIAAESLVMRTCKG